MLETYQDLEGACQQAVAGPSRGFIEGSAAITGTLAEKASEVARSSLKIVACILGKILAWV